MHQHNRREMKIVESFDKHSILLLLPIFFTKNGSNLTEENKKQEPERQHYTMSLRKYQNQYPKSRSFQIKTNFTKRMILKNPGISQKYTQKAGCTLKRYPK